MATNKTTELTSTFSKDVRGRQSLDQQNILVIWIDRNIDENNKDCLNTITQLKCTVNDLKIYTDGDQCIEFIETIRHQKICIVVSGSLGQQIVPRVHDLCQMNSIFIFCGDKKRHEKWVKEWPKINGVFTEIDPICEVLQQTTQLYEQNTLSISFWNTSKKLDQLDPSFMYTQILKDILSTIKFDNQHIKDFADHCRHIYANDRKELKNIEELKRKYHKKTPIWWYTNESFLYHMLNRALRMTDGDIIIRMGFFINDLHQQIDKLHKKEHITESFLVYRGQGLSKAEFKQLEQGGLISFNNFLSTSKSREVSVAFATLAVEKFDLVGILFIMDIDPKQSTIPFASIRDVSIQPTENEVLFSMHSIFRINDIKVMKENTAIFEVTLTLTRDNDNDLSILTTRIKGESFLCEQPWERLGLILKKLGQNDKAEEIYQMLLAETKNEGKKASFYHQLGTIRNRQAKYQEAIEFYEKSLAIYKNIIPSNPSNLASSYNNIGLVYFNMGDYSKSLSFHEKALAIREQSLPCTHVHLATSYNNIGTVYGVIGEYEKALPYFEKAREIVQKSFPSNHPELSKSYGNIGNMHYNMGDYRNALLYYKKTLKINQQSLPSNHPDLAPIYNNIGVMHENMKNYSEASLFFQDALEIAKQSLSSEHPDRQTYKRNVERTKMKS